MEPAQQGDCVCACGRSFAGHGPLNFHSRSCKSRKRLLHGALSKAKEIWEQRKKLRVASPEPEAPQTNIPMEPEPSEISDVSHADSERRPQRKNRRLPKRFRDLLPQPPPPLPPDLPTSTHSPTLADRPVDHSNRARLLKVFRTARNIFGLRRLYHSTELPKHDPDALANVHDLSEFPTTSTPAQDCTSFHPYPNKNSFLLGDWYWTHGVQKSQESFKTLLSIVGDPDFKPQDVRETKWSEIDKTLAANEFDDIDKHEWQNEDAGWKRKPITIDIPFHNRMKKPGTQQRVVFDLYHRSVVSVIKEKLGNSAHNAHFHYEPYELLWKPTDDSDEVRVHGELYTSPAFQDAHRDLQESPGEPGCNLPRVVVALMFSSDATHLTSFGNAQLWPCYMFFGNESKYRRCRPSCKLCNHIAYFQKLPASLKDFLADHTGGKGPNPALLAHCHREAFHAQWETILDDEFVHAYEHGIVIECCDGVVRRFYPRIFTYSADYPEKVLISLIRNRGNCPCPRCLIPKSRLQNLGIKTDMMQRASLARVADARQLSKISSARSIIYEKRYAVDGQAIDNILKEEGWVANSNAFSKRLAHLGFNIYDTLVVDLMHEFELGVWKALFVHLIRILNSIDASLVNEMDRRFRQVPTFGSDTIRKFAGNVSELKRLAARDFEDLLQCAIPVFDGLFPEPHNTAVLRLLFLCAKWHGLAKLRMHTDHTLCLLDETTIELGKRFREFVNLTCKTFKTHELKREAEARQRRQLKSNKATKTSTTTRQPKSFNLQTYKLHALGDYVATIRRYGTCDSYTTEIGELEHRVSKANFARTNRRQFVRHIAQIERRQARILRIRSQQATHTEHDHEKIAPCPDTQYIIAKNQNTPLDLSAFIQKHLGDPAINEFIPKLKKHLLPRIRSLIRPELPFLPENEPSIDWNAVVFHSGRIYQHKGMRLNFTTYDVRRDEDVVHTNTSRSNIMVLNSESSNGENRFCYARVLAIFHANVIYLGEDTRDFLPRRLEFLWVRWYDVESTTPFAAGLLDCLRFPPLTFDDSFGFLDPADILRGCHIIPLFSQGQVHSDGIGISHLAEDANDWKIYCVNRFVDRDMVMRHHWGLGVGHKYAHDKMNLSKSVRENDWETEEPIDMTWDEDSHQSDEDGSRNETEEGDSGSSYSSDPDHDHDHDEVSDGSVIT